MATFNVLPEGLLEQYNKTDVKDWSLSSTGNKFSIIYKSKQVRKMKKNPCTWARVNKGLFSFTHYLASLSRDPHKAWYQFGCLQTVMWLLLVLVMFLFSATDNTNKTVLWTRNYYVIQSSMCFLGPSCTAATAWHHPTPVIQESRDDEQLPTKSKRAHMQEKCAKMMSWSCCCTLSSAPFLLIHSLTKSQHIHFPCSDMGPIIIIRKVEQQKKKEKIMPKLIRINLVTTVLEYLYNTEGPFNFWNVYKGQQLLLWQDSYTLHSSIWLEKVLIKHLLDTRTRLGTGRDTNSLSLTTLLGNQDLWVSIRDQRKRNTPRGTGSISAFREGHLYAHRLDRYKRVL